TVAAPNSAPVVSAGSNQTIFLPNNVALLNGTVTDDGLPVGGALSLTWTKSSGPGTVSFSNPNQASTTATFSVAGTYVLTLTANDSNLSAASPVSVSVVQSAQPAP